MDIYKPAGAVITALAIILASGCSYGVSQKPETLKVSDSYITVSDDVKTAYMEKDDVIPFFDKGTGILFLTWDECPWCHRYIDYLETATEGIDVNINVYDIYNDRKENTDLYKEITGRLSSYLYDSGASDESGKPRIYVPAAVFISDGRIIGFDNTSSMEHESTPTYIDYFWDEENGEGESREDLLLKKISGYACTVCERLSEIRKRGCSESCSIK